MPDDHAPGRPGDRPGDSFTLGTRLHYQPQAAAGLGGGYGAVPQARTGDVDSRPRVKGGDDGMGKDKNDDKK